MNIENFRMPMLRERGFAGQNTTKSAPATEVVRESIRKIKAIKPIAVGFKPFNLSYKYR